MNSQEIWPDRPPGSNHPTEIRPDRISGPRWYRSLYWRMAVGALAGLAGLLLAQVAFFLWIAGRADRPFLDRSPQHVLRFVTLNLTAALEAEPALDLGTYLREQFRRLPWRVFVVRSDGTVLTNRDFTVPPHEVEVAADMLRTGEAPEPEPDRRTAAGRGRPRLGRIVLNGQVVAVVGLAAREGPLVQVFQEYGGPLALAAVLLLVAGAGGIVLFVLAPVRRRLRGLQQAADELGAGNSATRAPEAGGDEVAALAGSFNRMAAELEARLHELKQSDRLRRQLLADVSHELMTPLTAMRGYLETLALPGAVRDEATRDRYVRIVTDETLRLESIVGDLLDLARLEGGGTELQRRGRAGELALRADCRTAGSARCRAAHHARPHDRARRRPRARRRTAPRAGVPESRRQRRAPHAGRGPDHARCQARGRPRGDRRRRHRSGHPARAPAIRVRSLLQGGRGPHAGVHAGQRAGPLHRPGDRRTPRRHRDGHEPARIRRPLRGGAGSGAACNAYVAQAFRPAIRRPGRPEGLRYMRPGRPEGLRYMRHVSRYRLYTLT